MTATDAVRAVTPPGQPPTVWADRIAAVRERSLVELASDHGWPNHSRLLVLAAHPDDETLGCGRLMHAWSRRAPVTAFTATAGEACFDQVMPRPPGLADLRLEEWRRALALLGADSWPCLRLPDGELEQHEAALTDELDRWLDREATIDVVLAAPWREDPHPDHRACGRVAARVAARWQLPLIEYPVWMGYWTDPTAASELELIKLRSDPGAEQASRLARAQFVSQLTPPAPDLGPVLPPEMLAHHGEQVLIIGDSA